MSTVQIVQSIADANGYGNYPSQIRDFANFVDRGESSEYLSRRLVAYGASPVIADRLVSQVQDAVRTAAHVAVTPTAGSFDRATAASVVRAFITDGQPHLRSAGARGASEEQVTALLQIAGLEDVPEPEPVADAEAQHDGLLTRLASWARGRGFAG